jgi:hypothetical protein
MENALIRKDLMRLATRDASSEVLGVLADRIGNFEALMETRFDRLGTQVAALAERPP